jgi:hypothetical protein
MLLWREEMQGYYVYLKLYGLRRIFRPCSCSTMNNVFCDHRFDHRFVANATELARQVALRVPQALLPRSRLVHSRYHYDIHRYWLRPLSEHILSRRPDIPGAWHINEDRACSLMLHTRPRSSMRTRQSRTLGKLDAFPILDIVYTKKNDSRTAIGLRVKDGIVLAVEKIVHSKLLIPEANRRIQTVDRHIGMARIL